jgi:hypothetical protein
LSRSGSSCGIRSIVATAAAQVFCRGQGLVWRCGPGDDGFP